MAYNLEERKGNSKSKNHSIQYYKNIINVYIAITSCLDGVYVNNVDFQASTSRYPPNSLKFHGDRNRLSGELHGERGREIFEF